MTSIKTATEWSTATAFKKGHSGCGVKEYYSSAKVPTIKSLKREGDTLAGLTNLEKDLLGSYIS